MSNIDLSRFYRDDREGEFSVLIDVRASVRETVNAASKEEARAKVEAMLDENEIDLSGSDFDVADVSYVMPSPPMYLVVREGRVMAVSHVQDGDEPREPIDSYEASYRLPTQSPVLSNEALKGEA